METSVTPDTMAACPSFSQLIGPKRGRYGLSVKAPGPGETEEGYHIPGYIEHGDETKDSPDLSWWYAYKDIPEYRAASAARLKAWKAGRLKQHAEEEDDEATEEEEDDEATEEEDDEATEDEDDEATEDEDVRPRRPRQRRRLRSGLRPVMPMLRRMTREQLLGYIDILHAQLAEKTARLR